MTPGLCLKLNLPIQVFPIHSLLFVPIYFISWRNAHWSASMLALCTRQFYHFTGRHIPHETMFYNGCCFKLIFPEPANFEKLINFGLWACKIECQILQRDKLIKINDRWGACQPVNKLTSISWGTSFHRPVDHFLLSY